MKADNLMNLTKKQILSLDPKDFLNVDILGDVIIAWAKTLGCYWKYGDFKKNPADVHAILKSKLHSDVFFNVREMLNFESVRRIFAQQMSAFINFTNSMDKNVLIAGIPTGATMLARDIAEITKHDIVEMQKDADGNIKVISGIPPKSNIVFIEDVSTRRTAVREAYRQVTSLPGVGVISYVLAVVDRAISRENDYFTKTGLPGERRILTVKALVNARANEWNGKGCPLCKKNSTPMKPKTPPENWEYFQ